MVCFEITQEVGDEKGPRGERDDLEVHVNGVGGLALGLGAVARPEPFERGHIVHLAELLSAECR